MQLATRCAVGLALLTATGCFPDRIITDPDVEPLEARRPSAVHSVPKAGATSVPTNGSFTVWFDKLMNEASVIGHFNMYPNVLTDSITASAIDPAHPDVMYVGKVNTGILKSTNGGNSWKWVTMSLGYLKVTDLAISPGEPNTVYAGTSAGVYKSIDAGLNWNAMNNGLTDLAVSGIGVDRQQATKVFVSTLIGGVFVSIDGGGSWTAQNNGLSSVLPILGEAFLDIANDPNDSAILYVGTRNNRIYKSTNGGGSWSLLGPAPRSVRRIAIAPGNPNTIYAGTINAGVSRSTNAGATWSVVNTGLGNLDIYALAVLPKDSLTVVAGTPAGVYKTTDGGTSWSSPATGTTGLVTTLTYHPTTPASVLAGSSANIYYSTDGGSAFYVPGGISRTYVEGSFVFETWQDSTRVISNLDPTKVDTTVITPFVFERALTLWIANGRQGIPPVDPNPKATKATFTPKSPLLSKWNYQVRIDGTYESDGVTLQAERGAEDIHGNSLQTDKVINFVTE